MKDAPPPAAVSEAIRIALSIFNGNMTSPNEVIVLLNSLSDAVDADMRQEKADAASTRH